MHLLPFECRQTLSAQNGVDIAQRRLADLEATERLAVIADGTVVVSGLDEAETVEKVARGCYGRLWRIKPCAIIKAIARLLNAISGKERSSHVATPREIRAVGIEGRLLAAA